MKADTNRPEYPSDEWWDLHAQIEELWPLIESNTPPGCKLQRLFRQAKGRGNWDRDGDAPTAEAMNVAICAFIGLPEPERLRICNGWATDDERYPLASFREDYAKRTRYEVLTVEPHRSGVFYAIEHVAEESTSAVRIVVKFGTIKAEALSIARALLDDLERRWDDVIVDPYDERGKEREAAEELLSPPPDADAA